MANNIPDSPAAPDVQPEAAPAPFDQNRTTPEAFGAGGADNAQQLGAMYQQKARAERETAVMSAVFQSTADTEQAINSELVGFGKLQGENAAAQSEATLERIQQARTKAIGGIADPDVARITAMRTIGSVTAAQKEIDLHVAQESQNVFRQASQATIDTSLDSVGRHAAIPELRQRDISNMQGPLTAMASKLGLPGDIRDPSTPAGDWARKEFYGKASQVTLNTLLAANNVNGAAAYFAQPGVRDAIGPVAAEEFEGRLRAHQDLQGSIVDGFSILQRNKIAGTSLYNEAAARAQALNQLQDKVSPERLVKTLDFIHEQAQLGLDSQQKQNAQQFNTALSSAMTQAQAGQPVLIPPDTLAYLADPKNQAGAQRLALDEAVRRVQENGYNAVPTSQQATNYGRMLLAMVDPGQGYGAKSIDEMHANAMQLAGGVTPRQLGELDTHLAAAHAQADQNIEGQLVTHVRDEMIRAKVPGTNKSFEKWDDNSSAALPYVVDKVEKAVQAAGGKKAANLQEVIAKATRDAIVNVNVNGTGLIFRDTTSRAIAETAPQYANHAIEPVIPRSERKAISAALVGAGIKTPTDAQVMTAYKKRHGFQ